MANMDDSLNSSGSGILDTVKVFLTPDLIGRASHTLSESPQFVKQALNALAPTALMGLIRYASSQANANRLLNMMSSSSTMKPTTLSVQGAPMVPMSMVESIFGGNLSSVTQNISDSTGLKSASVATLLATILGPIFQVIKTRLSGNLTPEALMGLLRTETSNAAAALPKSVSNVFGLAPYTTAADTMNLGASYLTRSETESKNMTWAIGAAIIAVLLGGIFWLARSKPSEPISEAPPPPVAAPTQPLPDAAVPQTTESTAENPNEILRNFLNISDVSQLPKRIDFRAIEFGVATADLTPNGQAAVTELAQILKDNPDVRVRLEGHTDNTGNEETNKTLSEARAFKVKDVLSGNGVIPEHIETLGLGSEQPIAPNDTEDGRARNRRIEVVVTEIGNPTIAH